MICSSTKEIVLYDRSPSKLTLPTVTSFYSWHVAQSHNNRSYNIDPKNTGANSFDFTKELTITESFLLKVIYSDFHVDKMTF